MHISTYLFFTYVLLYMSCKTGAPRKNVSYPHIRQEGAQTETRWFLLFILNIGIKLKMRKELKVPFEDFKWFSWGWPCRSKYEVGLQTRAVTTSVYFVGYAVTNWLLDLLLLFLLLLHKQHYSPMRTFASLMDFPQSAMFFDLYF